MAVDVTHEAISAQRAETTASAGEARAALDVQTTTCCIVGGGPAGLMLALCLARKNVPVMLLEAHHDFNRDFRGDTLHPSVLTIMDELGLADRLLDLPHTKMSTMRFQPPNGGGALVVDVARGSEQPRWTADGAPHLSRPAWPRDDRWDSRMGEPVPDQTRDLCFRSGEFSGSGDDTSGHRLVDGPQFAGGAFCERNSRETGGRRTTSP